MIAFHLRWPRPAQGLQRFSTLHSGVGVGRLVKRRWAVEWTGLPAATPCIHWRRKSRREEEM